MTAFVLLGAVTIVSASVNAEEIDCGQIDRFESLATGTLHVGTPPKTIVDDGERLKPADEVERELATGLGERQIAEFKDARLGDLKAILRLSVGLGQVWDDQFPMILLPDQEEGLGMAILNSNAEAHFSFTNALGMVSTHRCTGLTQRSASFLTHGGLSRYITI